jgi:sulfite reductase alpha subunit-like flavoprotein
MSSKTKDGIKDYYEFCVREKRNVYEVLFDFNSVKIPLVYLIDGISLQKPREYSISSDY